MNDSVNLCQLYKYNKEFYLVNKNSPEHFAADFVSSEISDEHTSWLNFHSVECSEDISLLLEKLNVDKLVIEDIYTEKKRPKVEDYDNYIFFSVRSALPPEEGNVSLRQEQVSFILGENYLISLQQKKSDHFTEVRSRIVHNKGKIRSKGSDFLMFRMLEAIVENYYEVLEDITQKTSLLEARVLRSSHSQTLKLIETEKRRLGELRRIALPMKDITSHIEKSKSALFPDENKGYFLDLKDYCLGVLDEIDSTKQILEGLTNLYYAVQGQRMNEIMKLLTVISAIFIPLTFLAGIYGMNFDNIPELHYHNAYYILLGAMALLAVLLIFYFRKRGWLNEK